MHLWKPRHFFIISTIVLDDDTVIIPEYQPTFVFLACLFTFYMKSLPTSFLRF